MYSEPCVRLGIRISPKIRAKPDESRNNSPPNVMLLTVSDTQKFMCAAFALRSCRRSNGYLDQLPLRFGISALLPPRAKRVAGGGRGVGAFTVESCNCPPTPDRIAFSNPIGPSPPRRGGRVRTLRLQRR